MARAKKIDEEALHSYLARIADDTGVVRLSQVHLSLELGVSIAILNRALNRMAYDGLLTKLPRERHSSVYRVNPPEASEPETGAPTRQVMWG